MRKNTVVTDGVVVADNVGTDKDLVVNAEFDIDDDAMADNNGYAVHNYAVVYSLHNQAIRLA